ncbi:MAG: biotin/lipoyl-binding protein [Chlamydiales bacterium]|nr:biotin/lipoyl-binding protein [Chlamydiales bacterium]
MIRKLLLPIIALLGIFFGVWLAIKDHQTTPPQPPLITPPYPPYNSYIAGAALIEAIPANIAVGTTSSGLVTNVYVRVGTPIKAGDPLFKIDDTTLKATLDVELANAQLAEANLNTLLLAPRDEDVWLAEDLVKQNEGMLGQAKDQLALVRNLTDVRAISIEEIHNREFAVQIAEANLAYAKHSLLKTVRGAWIPDIEVSRKQYQAALANIAQINTQIDLLTVRSPIDGEVLQVNVHEGEFAVASDLSQPSAQPRMVVGYTKLLYLRVDIDEYDAWRFSKEANAAAYLKGNPRIRIPIHYEYTEPYVVPKQSLTGASTERVDTRVLQVIYSFDPKDFPVYVGLQMDIFIEAPSLFSYDHPSKKAS